MSETEEWSRPFVRISYTTFSHEDFDGIKEFGAELYKSSEITIARKISEEAGGGFFDLIIEVAKSLTIEEFIRSYAEDAVKYGIAFFAREIFSAAKKLFQRNTAHDPSISAVRLILRDFRVFIYSLYPNSVETVTEEVLAQVCARYPSIARQAPSPVKALYVPVFDVARRARADTDPKYWEISDDEPYRTVLQWDEVISAFGQSDYFQYWGVVCADGRYVYELEHDRLIRKGFGIDPFGVYSSHQIFESSV